MAGFLSDKGSRVLRNGYNVIPIKPGEKFPSIADWRTIETNLGHLQQWRRNGRADHGLGITTGATPFVDLDIPDGDACVEMQEWILDHIGLAPVRIGNAPKRGLVFRTEAPFRKVSSRQFADDEGRRAQVEILGEGQQFVAYHIHPDTGKPYHWIGRNDGPEHVPASELPTLTVEQAQRIVEHFEEIAEARGWPVKRPNLPAATASYGRPALADDELGLGLDPLGLTDAELTAKVMIIPNDDLPYEDGPLNWLHVIMAIWHETAGSEFGRDLAYSWSDQSSKHTDARFTKAWNSFGKSDTSRRPITARYILKYAKEFEQQALVESVNDIILRMDLAPDLTELKAICIDARKLDVDIVDRSRLIVALQKNMKRYNVPLGLKDARELVRYQPEIVETPDWLEGWVYLSHADRFFNTIDRTMLTETAFNNTFHRFTGDTEPANVALNVVKIDTVFMHGYMPTEETFFTLGGRRYVNSYTERNVPKIPAKLEGADRENVLRIIRHIAHLFPDKREAEILTSWFAYLVQTKQRPNWAVVLQGVEGDGRSFFAVMMAAVLGGDNVRTLNAQTLESPYTAWAEGQLFTAIEEVRMAGHNRHDVMNRIKPLITNATIEIHPKNLNPYTAPNTTAYMLTTNFQNALPVDENDRRYFVLMSQFQNAKALLESIIDQPDYFDKLYATVNESAGAILGWLKLYKIHEDFRPLGRAPASQWHEQMAEHNKTDEIVAFEDIVESGFYPEISEDVVVVSKLAEILSAKNPPYQVKETTCAAILRTGGYNYLGRVMLGERKVSLWSKTIRPSPKGFASATLRARHLLENPL